VLSPVGSFADCYAIGCEFLAETDGDGILHVGAAGLHDAVELCALLREGGGERIELWIEGFEREERRYAHRCRKDIVGRLAVVDVIVGMNLGILAELAPEDFVGAIGDDFVGVHVKADAGSGLENVDDKFVVPATVDNFQSGMNDGVGAARVDGAQFAVGFGGGEFDHGDGANEQGMGTHAADGIVLDGAGGLHAVVGGGGDREESEGVFFFAGCCHR
jgi:hypothetical protein